MRIAKQVVSTIQISSCRCLREITSSWDEDARKKAIGLEVQYSYPALQYVIIRFTALFFSLKYLISQSRFGSLLSAEYSLSQMSVRKRFQYEREFLIRRPGDAITVNTYLLVVFQ
jgi:hypothetical protein